MRRMLLFLAWLLPAPFCSAQILLQPDPHAISYMYLAGQPPRPIFTPLTSDENGKYQQVYDAVLRNNAALDAEGDALSARMDAYRSGLMAAMVKLDPNVAPMLATSSDTPLTAAQSAEILQTQFQAMKADPTLQPAWDDLTKKMTAHAQAVDAAMLKLDPTVAPILAKFSQ